MSGQKFTDLFNAQKEFEENFSLMLTEMNYEEVVRHFKKNLGIAINTAKEGNTSLSKLSNTIEKHNYKELKEQLITEFNNKINEIFIIHVPENDDAYKKAVIRFYENKMPFRDNKQEFKDSIIWETIYDYAQMNPDETIYFISDNFKDFSNREEENLKFHSDFDDLDGKIIYKRSINDFLEEIEYLKIHHFEFRQKDELLGNIEDTLLFLLDGDAEVSGNLIDWFGNRTFRSEYFEGWGVDPYLTNIKSINFDEDAKVYGADNYFYIPILVEATVHFNVETRNPVYERGDDDEFLSSESLVRTILCSLVVHYNIKEETIDNMDEFEIVDFS